MCFTWLNCTRDLAQPFRLVLLSLVLLWVLGCDETNRRHSDIWIVETDSETEPEPGTDEGDCHRAIDIVFVLDVSTSMTGFMAILEEEIGLVWQKAVELSRGEEPHFGLVVFVDDYLLVSEATYADQEAIQADFHTWYTHTQSNGQTLSNIPNFLMPENSLDALRGAAMEYPWRDGDDILRIVIHASDAGFLEYPANFSSPDLPAQHTYQETVRALQDGKIRVATFADTLNPEGFFTKYQGQPPIPQATSGFAFDLYALRGGRGRDLCCR